MDDPALLALLDETLASCEAIANRDVAGWMDPFHEDAVTYNEGFVPIAVIRSVADTLIDSFKSFSIHDVDGRIVDDTAILFGNYVTELADGTTRRGAFTLTFVRTSGEWKSLLTHYTPTG